MKNIFLSILLIFMLAVPVEASAITAPPVPESAAEHMPDTTVPFADGLLYLVSSSLMKLRPDLKEAADVCISTLAAVILLSVLALLSPEIKSTVSAGGVAMVSCIFLRNTNSMIQLATDVIRKISEYGKLLCPVMASALAAQGGVTSSAALYTGTVAFSAVLHSLLSELLIPMVYFFLAFSIAGYSFGEETLNKMADLIKGVSAWILKTLMIIFTTYMSITGVVCGGADAASLKAAKITISTTVPVVGGILSDASESVLAGINIMKNAAGVYGILAVLSLFLEPFLRVGVHYLFMKLFGALYGVFGSKQLTGLTESFTAALGLLLAMIGAGCILVLISTVCFLRGVG